MLQSVALSGVTVHAITAGDLSPDTAEGVATFATAELLEEVRAFYDYVIVDAPSFPLAADALVLSTCADHVLSVVRLGHTKRSLAEEHFHRLCTSAHCAVVINASEASTHDPYGYGRIHDTARSGMRRQQRLRHDTMAGPPA